MKRVERIQIELPAGFMNVGVTSDNHLVADTNDSANWDSLKFPLPKGKWVIVQQMFKFVILEKKKRFFLF